jgi:hypothetical protein
MYYFVLHVISRIKFLFGFQNPGWELLIAIEKTLWKLRTFLLFIVPGLIALSLSLSISLCEHELEITVLEALKILQTMNIIVFIANYLQTIVSKHFLCQLINN